MVDSELDFCHFFIFLNKCFGGKQVKRNKFNTNSTKYVHVYMIHITRDNS